MADDRPTPSGGTRTALEPVTVDGPAGRLAGWVTADAADDTVPVLFIHPINMQGRIWADVVERLRPRRRCLLPDLRAHGTSDTAGDLGLDAWVSDCEAFLDAQGVSGPMHVVGGSLGGSLACCLAARRPGQVVSVAGIGSSLHFTGVDVAAVLDTFDELGVAGTFRKVFPEITFGPGCPQEIIELGLSLANPNDVETVKRVWYATVTSDSTSRAALVTAPALVLTGEHDATCTPALGLEMARVLRTEQVLMPGVGHMPMLENPERVAVLLDRHFAQSERALAC
ncbi:alpha/beta fold hydrolase [Pseudonocardia hispaniensis]|uniref:Alpha/beta fold hydrolase n=1 Tax=Pseudonocardia hispaniensis TaxID=904933 RepID=A0ABW1J8J2_9PSEU